MENTGKTLFRVARLALFLAILTPLVIISNITFPFIVPKVLFFRGVIEVAGTAFLGALFVGLPASYRQIVKKRTKALIRNPISWGIGGLLLSAIISTVGAVSPYRSFWGTIERGDGLMDLLHLAFFFVLTGLLFRKKDWGKFLLGTMGIGTFIALYGVLEYLQVPLPLVAEGQSRISSLIGNPAMLSTYLFLIISVSFLWFSRKTRMHTWLPIAVAITSGVTILLSQTRSAIVGATAGVLFVCLYFVIKKPKPTARYARKIAGGILLIALLGGVLVFTTRANPLWESVPGISRLVRTSLLSREDSSTATRLLTWRLSLEAFKERPVAGWGLENYIFAWQKHYDPRISIYGEPWLDKPHNKAVEVAVQTGTLGLVAYLGVFVALAKTLWKKPFVLAGIIAYAAHSLFLFDDINSYLILFVIVGFSVHKKKKHKQTELSMGDVKTSSVSKGASALGMAGVIYALYAYNFVPFVQASKLVQVKEIGKAEEIVEKLAGALEPYNYAQQSLRGELMDHYSFQNPEVFENPELAFLSNALLGYVIEPIAREPHDDVRMLIRVHRILYARTEMNEEFLKEDRDVLRKALKLSPNRQELHYMLSQNLGYSGLYEEAEQVAREAVTLEPKVARARANLGIVLALSYGKERKEEVITEFEKVLELDPTLRTFGAEILHNMAAIYANWGEVERLTSFVVADARDKIEGALSEEVFFDIALQHLISGERSGDFIAVAELVAKRYPERAEDMVIFIDLVKKEKWNIIQNLTRP